jgi:hypothetical protein
LKIRPSKLPVQERDFDKPKIVNEFIKLGSFRPFKVAIRFVPRRSSEVEIPHDGNRPGKRSKNLGKGVKEGLLLIMDTRAIYIDNGEGEAVSSMGEGRGDGELVNRVVHKL